MKAKTAPPPPAAAHKSSLPAATESKASLVSVSAVQPIGRTRFRVAIKTSTLDPTLLVVRRVEEGAALPDGTHEGWIESSNVDVAYADSNGAR